MLRLQLVLPVLSFVDTCLQLAQALPLAGTEYCSKRLDIILLLGLDIML